MTGWRSGWTRLRCSSSPLPHPERGPAYARPITGGPTPPGASAPILVVDDVADIRDLCRYALESAGHHVLEAPTGEQAIEILDAETPDGVLLDIGLPGMDGWGVLRMIRERADLRQLKVIVFSAHASPEEERRAQTEGASGFLSKPFPMRDLRALFQPG